MNARPISLREIARVVGGRVVGDPDLQIRGLAPLPDAGPDHLGLLSHRGYVNAAARSRAGALLVAEEVLEALGDDPRPQVVVRDAQAALVPLLEHLHPEPEPSVGVHPTAILGTSVSLGPGVWVGPYAVLGDGVVVADGVQIAGHVTVGRDCRIGEGTVIHPSVVLYPRTVIGRRVLIHAGAKIGVDGFGFARVEGEYRKIPQVGRVVVEDDVEIGANSCIDRGSIGDTVIGSGSKLDNLVHIAHNVRVGERCAFAGQFGVAGSTRIGNEVVAGGQSGIAGHLDVGDGVQLAAKSGLTEDADPGSALMGHPARDLQLFLKANALTYRLPELRKQVRQLEDRLESLRGGDAADQTEE